MDQKTGNKNSEEKGRITITLPKESIDRIEAAAQKFGIPKTFYVVNTVMERVVREEKEDK